MAFQKNLPVSGPIKDRPCAGHVMLIHDGLSTVVPPSTSTSADLRCLSNLPKFHTVGLDLVECLVCWERM